MLIFSWMNCFLLCHLSGVKGWDSESREIHASWALLPCHAYQFHSMLLLYLPGIQNPLMGVNDPFCGFLCCMVFAECCEMHKFSQHPPPSPLLFLNGDKNSLCRWQVSYWTIFQVGMHCELHYLWAQSVVLQRWTLAPLLGRMYVFTMCSYIFFGATWECIVANMFILCMDIILKVRKKNLFW